MGIELSSDPGALRFERPTKIWEQLGNKTPGSEVVFWVPTPTKAIESSSIWRKRVGVEPKYSTPNSRRMMTLQLPPSSNWSQLESEPLIVFRNSTSSLRTRRENS